MDREFEIGGVSFMQGFSDISRASRQIGVGSVLVGGKYEALSRMIQRMGQTPKEKFMNAVQLICYEEELPFSESVYSTISDRYEHPDYLHPLVCVLVLNNGCIQGQGVNLEKFKDPIFLEKISDKQLDILDVYRYAHLISNLLQNK